MAESKADLLARFKSLREDGEVIIGGGAGVGISAKAQVAGGVDFLVVYNSGRFRRLPRWRCRSILGRQEKGREGKERRCQGQARQ